MMLMRFVFITLATFVAQTDGISSHGGIYGKKRNKLSGLASPSVNRFLCPGCADRKKELKTSPTQIDTKFLGHQNVEVHCMKGDKGDKGEPGDNGLAGVPGPQGPKGSCDKEQIEIVVRPLRAKVDALLSSYTTEIARLRNEIRSLKSKFVHTLGSEANPASSCKEIYQQEKYSPSGVYYLNITGVPRGITRVYCHMDESETCPAGATLVLKIDGTKDTFKYSSPLWSNKKVYNEDNGLKLFDSNETKLASYWSVPFTRVCINMRKLDSFEVVSLVIDEASSSLYDILADGKYRATKGGRKIWETLLSSSQIQSGCYREGFNAHGTKSKSAGARIGVVASSQSNCSKPDSFIGFGTEGACADSKQISLGNVGGCNSDIFIPAFGYIFVY